MSSTSTKQWRPAVGVCVAGLELTAPLAPREVEVGGVALQIERWLALDQMANADACVYRWPDFGAVGAALSPAGPAAGETVGHRIDRVCDTRRGACEVGAVAEDAGDPESIDHLIRLHRIEGMPDGRLWAFTPYRGNHDGLLTLEALRVQRGGTLPAFEVARAVGHLLRAIEAAGAVAPLPAVLRGDEVLVDRGGLLWLELTGLEPENGGHGAVECVRALVGLAYRLLTGSPGSERPAAASQLAPRVSKGWDRWIADGLDPSKGYETPAAATAALAACIGAPGSVLPAGAGQPDAPLGAHSVESGARSGGRSRGTAGGQPGSGAEARSGARGVLGGLREGLFGVLGGPRPTDRSASTRSRSG